MNSNDVQWYCFDVLKLLTSHVEKFTDEVWQRSTNSAVHAKHTVFMYMKNSACERDFVIEKHNERLWLRGPVQIPCGKLTSL